MRTRVDSGKGGGGRGRGASTHRSQKTGRRPEDEQLTWEQQNSDDGEESERGRESDPRWHGVESGVHLLRGGSDQARPLLRAAWEVGRRRRHRRRRRRCWGGLITVQRRISSCAGAVTTCRLLLFCPSLAPAIARFSYSLTHSSALPRIRFLLLFPQHQQTHSETCQPSSLLAFHRLPSASHLPSPQPHSPRQLSREQDSHQQPLHRNPTSRCPRLLPRPPCLLVRLPLRHITPGTPPSATTAPCRFTSARPPARVSSLS